MIKDLKFRKVRNKEEWRSTVNSTWIRKVYFHPDGRPYEIWDGYRHFVWVATFEEAKARAQSDYRFNSDRKYN